jgi:hypothetical protein
MKEITDELMRAAIKGKRKSQGFSGVIPKALARKAAQALAALRDGSNMGSTD